MHQLLRPNPLRLAGIAAALALLALPPRPARADDLLGLYVGGGIGESRLEATLPGFGGAIQDHFAFEALAGIRPIPLLGAELQYVNLGQPSSDEDAYDALGLKMQGAAAYGMLYLPLVPVVDVYLKAGLSRLQSTVSNGFAPFGPSAFAFDRTNTSATEGLGVQYTFGSVAVRGDYAFFNAAGGHQNLLTAGITWTFL
ncbi:MAG TPA: outer membrane beta-barrel protein [Steroidobacteraceae bacterium]|nr:outer membrane beta-barrel protein [Steroidobacteraceae bacterium]